FFKTNGGRLDTGFAVYSMGNFISNQRWRYSDAGVVLKIIIKKNLINGTISISKVTILPTWVFKGKIKNKNIFEILPAADTLNNVFVHEMSDEDKQKMLQSFFDTKNILTLLTHCISVENIYP
ncbi:MAG: hypothetical protein WCA84_03700, partial [Ignavibacteriaceae bacterium]